MGWSDWPEKCRPQNFFTGVFGGGRTITKRQNTPKPKSLFWGFGASQRAISIPQTHRGDPERQKVIQDPLWKQQRCVQHLTGKMKTGSNATCHFLAPWCTWANIFFNLWIVSRMCLSNLTAYGVCIFVRQGGRPPREKTCSGYGLSAGSPRGLDRSGDFLFAICQIARSPVWTTS